MFDESKAKRAITFIENLKHTKGRWHGENFTLLPWQEEIITNIFGTVKENGYRQYNTCYCEIPKKNGKSELAAAIALYMTCGDGEWAAEVYGCASDRQQASIVFDVAVDMVDQCPALKKRIKPIMSVKRLVYQPTNSYYQVLSAEAYTKHGLNVHAAIIDELHCQPNRELFDVMTKGSGDARTQPLYFLITTAGTDRNSICFEQHMKAEDILAGRKKDPTFYPVIYGLPDDADWSDEKNWYIANPSLGHTIAIEKVRDAYQSAKENPAEENIFRQLRLDQWVKQSTRWMPMDKWDECAFSVDPEELVGRECYGGLDLSSTSDLTAFVLVFPPRTEDEKYVILPYCWIPEDNMRLRIRRDHVPYDTWEATGDLKTTEGNVIHYKAFGYRAGEKKGTFEIEPEEAKIIKQIYKWVRDEYAIVTILKMLKEAGYHTRTGQDFPQSLIYGIVRNVIYKGDYIMQRTYVDDNRKKHFNKGEVQSWYIENDHPAIVTKRLWAQANEVLDLRAAERVRQVRILPMTEVNYPYKNKLYCGYCGQRLYPVKAKTCLQYTFFCRKKNRSAGECCPGVSVPQKVIESWGEITENIYITQDPDKPIPKQYSFTKESTWKKKNKKKDYFDEMKPYTKENYHYYRRIFCEKCGWPLYRIRRFDGKIQFICAGNHKFHAIFCTGIIVPEEVLNRLPEKDGYFLLKEEIIDGEKHYSYSCRSNKPERKKPERNEEN